MQRFGPAKWRRAPAVSPSRGAHQGQRTPCASRRPQLGWGHMICTLGIRAPRGTAGERCWEYALGVPFIPRRFCSACQALNQSPGTQD